MWHEEQGHHREGGNVYLENSWFSQMLWGNGEQDPIKLTYNKYDMAESRVYTYLKADMVSFTMTFAIW